MDALFSPDSVAIIGATNDAAKIGNRIISNLLEHGYEGKLFPVNPKGGSILDRPVLESVEDIPHGVDLAFLAVPLKAVAPALQACISKGVKHVVALTAGFKETGGDGERFEREMADLIHQSSTRLVGPNCAGLCNTWNHFHGTIEIYPKEGEISLISQSGSLCSAMSSNMVIRDCGISKYISVGNKADVQVADLVDYLGEDPTTKCIALYLEDISDGKRLYETALRVSHQKPIVILKSGRTVEGARATLSHTGAMAGEDAITDGAFRQVGIIRVDELTQLYDVAAALSKIGPLRGRKIGILSDAGGPGVLATDAAIANGLQVPRPSEEAREALRAHLAGFASVQNPVDMTFTRDVELYARCVEILYGDGMDGILISIPSHFSVKEKIVSVLTRVREELRVPMALSWLCADEVEEERRALWRNGIPAFGSPEQAIYCMGRLAWYGTWLAHRGEGKNRRSGF
jgi:acetyltransferase